MGFRRPFDCFVQALVMASSLDQATPCVMISQCSPAVIVILALNWLGRQLDRYRGKGFRDEACDVMPRGEGRKQPAGLQIDILGQTMPVL
jgi:hypothetical protein